MSKEQTQELMMGAVLVVLAYALYRHFKPSKVASKAPATAGIMPGEPAPKSYGDYTGSPITSMLDLLAGTVTDIGAYQGKNYLDDISDPYISGETGVYKGEFQGWGQ